MTTERLYELVDGWLEDRLGKAELRELEAGLGQPGVQELLEARIQSQLEVRQFVIGEGMEETNRRILAKIQRRMVMDAEMASGGNAGMGSPFGLEDDIVTREGSVRVMDRRVWMAAAAMLLAAALIWVVVGRFVKRSLPDAVTVLKANDIAPGRNGAILTLGNGRTIVLDSSGQGVIAHQGGSDVLLQKNQLIYQDARMTGPDTAKAIAFNMLSTPRGRQYHVVLPDGSQAWLNSMSSIRYPVRFEGQERKVGITGEVYFEVAENKDKPFRVEADSTEVEVLGTSFNVHAYADEDANLTTLLSGKVRVSEKGGSVVLKPGQQATCGSRAGGPVSAEADVDKAMAWRSGFFEFDQLDIKQIMREVSRWYDVEIRYEGRPPANKLGGRISRDLPLSQLLQSLETDNIQFQMDGRTLIIKS